MREAEGVPLPDGRMTSGLVRHGDRGRGAAGPGSPAVHEYLRHLASAGFESSPRVLATGDGWEELTYIEGEVAFDPDWQPGRGNRLPPQARPRAAGAAAERVGPVTDLAAAAWASCRSRRLPSWPRPASTQCPTCPNDSGFSW